MDKFLEKYNFPKLNHEEIKNLNSPITSTEIETVIRNLPAQVQTASLEKAMAPHSSTLAWKIPWTEDLVGYSLWGRKESDTTGRLHFHFHSLTTNTLAHFFPALIFTFQFSVYACFYLSFYLPHYTWDYLQYMILLCAIST